MVAFIKRLASDIPTGYVNSVYAYDDKIVVNFNCREEPNDTMSLRSLQNAARCGGKRDFEKQVPLPLKIVTDVSDLFRVGEPAIPLTITVGGIIL